MEKFINQIFENNKLEISDENFMSIIASLLCKKHNIPIENLNAALEQNLKYIECETLNTESLYSVFDSFMMSDRREKTGSYYTPYALAEKMVKMSFYDYFKKNGFIEDLDFFYNPFFYEENEGFINRLKTLKIVDIACGTGVFLLASIHVMISYYDVLKISYNMNDLINQVYGADIQETPLVLLDLFLNDLLLSKQYALKKCNLTRCDSILEYEPKIRFDLVIGNPPYVGEKGNKALFDRYKKNSGYEARMDLFYFFIYKGFDLLENDGVLSYITTNYWVTADGAKKLRQFVQSKTALLRLINLDECKMFSDAKGMHNLIFTLAKSSVDDVLVQVIQQSKVSDLTILYDHKYKITHKELFSETGNIILYEKILYYPIIHKILSNSFQTLNQVATINQGIVSGADKVTKKILEQKLEPSIVNRYDIKEADPIFVFDKKPFESKFFKPFYKNGQIKPYQMTLEDHRWILYLHDGDLDETHHEWQHLLPFKDVLSQRREVKNGVRNWYALQWGRAEKIFEGEKIVVPQRANYNNFAYTDQPFYSSADVYYLTQGPLKFLLGLLNSKLYYFWFYNRGKRKGKSLELYAKPLSQVPIPSMAYNQMEIYVEALLNNDQEAKSKIDNLLYEHFELTIDEINEVESLYNRGGNEKKIKH